MRARTAPLVLSALLIITASPVRAADPVATDAPPAEAADPTEAAAAAAAAAAPLDVEGRYIVILDEGANAKTVRDRSATRLNVRADALFQRAVQGFAGRFTPAQVAGLRSDPSVAAVVPDEIVEVASQLVPTGVSRSGARASTSTVAKIDGVDERVDADVAVVDTGIDPTHPDLNVVGGVNCSTSDRNLWRDVQGHGTHVGGTIGAIDNGNGVVGVAPGVRLWAVKILNDDGFGYLSWYVCGLDWIAAQRDPADPSRPLIEAVNMSVAKWGTDGGSCGTATNDILHQAICRVTSSGVTVVAAAANDAGSAAKRVPAAYNEVITVSALADTDGKSGGLGGNRCYSWGTYDVDDTFADFSNYGGDVDIIAPGKCIWSSLPGNRYGYSSGTSMAAPAVAGAVALYKASRPWATPSQVKSALQTLGSLSWATSTDPDGNPERLLNVSRLGPAGTFEVSPAPPAPIGEVGGTLTVPIAIDRSPTHFETLRLTATAPEGFPATLDQAVLTGFTASTATLTVTVPPSTPAGRYPVTIRADEFGRSDTASVEIVVENDAPTAASPSVAPQLKAALSGATAPVVVTWPAATDPTSAIAGYELQQSADGGEWSPSAAFGPTTRSAIRYVTLNQGHAFRVRAVDAAGNWSEWAAAPAVRLGIVDNRSATMRWSTGWYRYENRYAYNGTVHRTFRTGPTVRATVTARTVAIVAPVGPRQGWVRVYVDGVFQYQVSLYAASGLSRKIVWHKTFTTDATRVVELRAVVSSRRTRVDVDALLIGR